MIISTQCGMLQVHMVMTRNPIFGKNLDAFDYDINGVYEGGIGVQAYWRTILSGQGTNVHLYQTQVAPPPL